MIKRVNSLFIENQFGVNINHLAAQVQEFIKNHDSFYIFTE
jgi:hypothetical protein